MNAKAFDLVGPVLGARKARALIQPVNALEALDDISKLRPLLTV